MPGQTFYTKALFLEILREQGFSVMIELPGTRELREATNTLVKMNASLGEPAGPWTAVIVDRKKVPTVVFAFKQSADAVRARLILSEA